MSISTGIAIYFLIWWLALFVVLPWGVRSQHEDGGMAPGTDPGAPVLAKVWMKLLGTTAVAAVIFVVLWTVYEYRIVTLEDLARLLGSRR